MNTRRGFLGMLAGLLGMGAAKATEPSEPREVSPTEAPSCGRIRPVIELDLREKALSERLPEHVFTQIHEAIGMASMCWEKPEGAGVFDSCNASAIAFNLCHFIADELDKKSLGI